MRQTRWNIWKCGNCGKTIKLPAEAGAPDDWGCEESSNNRHAWYIDDYYTEESWG